MTLWKGQEFSVNHIDGSGFEAQGLRAFFEYRDLGINSATKGRFGAHIIRAVPGMKSEAQWHVHDLDFQMIYITCGWVVFEYEDQGTITMRKGSCALQPPGIAHRELSHSDDLELIEIISPAEFETKPVNAPQ